MSRFVEFTDTHTGKPIFVSAAFATSVKDFEGDGGTRIDFCGHQFNTAYVLGTPAEVVAKLQCEPQRVLGEYTTEDYRLAVAGHGDLYNTWKDKPHRLIYDLCAAIEFLAARPAVAAPPAESEAVQLLERWLRYHSVKAAGKPESFPNLRYDTEGLLAKLKGGA